MPEEERTYRRWIRSDLCTFEVRSGESDLFISADCPLVEPAQRALCAARAALEAYVKRDPGFATTTKPREALAAAPDIVARMSMAARACGVGPMAAVAGAIAEAVGESLLAQSKQVIVENGGDIFLRTERPRAAAIYAGASALSGKLAVRISRVGRPVGLCTSSGTVGHSLSFGKADAAVVLATSAALADAVATALGNRIQTADDIDAGLAWLKGIDGVLGGVAVVGEHIGAWGEIEFVRMPDSGTACEGTLA